MREIIQEPHPILRRVADPVLLSEIKSKRIQEIIADMNTLLDSQDDGVAIAAPQIAESVRIFVVSKKASKQLKKNTAFINPEIIRIGKEKVELEEGCLSVRWKYGMVKRSTSATVRAYNENGNEFVMSGRGLLAQIFQHEIDHLNGILFIDKARDIHEYEPE